MAYSKPRLSDAPYGTEQGEGSTLAKARDEYGSLFCWVTAEYVILKLRRGLWMEGYVNVQSESHLGIICWNLFNAGIEATRMPEGWRWVAGYTARGSKSSKNKESDSSHNVNGYWIDEHGEQIEGLVRFRVWDFEHSLSSGKDTGTVNIEGTLVTDERMKEIEEEKQTGGGRASSVGVQPGKKCT